LAFRERAVSDPNVEIIRALSLFNNMSNKRKEREREKRKKGKRASSPPFL